MPFVMKDRQNMDVEKVDGLDGVDGSLKQDYDADLAAIAALSGTSGLLRKTAANTWELDTKDKVASIVVADAVKQDPDATTDDVILTNTGNLPGAGYWYVRTYFYTSRTYNRVQVAYQYTGTTASVRTYVRSYYNGSWTGWVRTWNDHNHPTTLTDYGITDAVPSSRTVAGKELSSNIAIAFADLEAITMPTTLGGFGITDGVSKGAATDVADLNTMLTSGFFRAAAGATNNPAGASAVVGVSIQYSTYGVQVCWVAHGSDPATTTMYRRNWYNSGSSWTSWRAVIMGQAGGTYTQTYATAARTVSNPTAATLTDNSGGTANTTLESIGTTYSQTAIRNNFADLAAMVNKLTADNLVLYKLVTALIDDLQLQGIVG